MQHQQKMPSDDVFTGTSTKSNRNSLLSRIKGMGRNSNTPSHSTGSPNTSSHSIHTKRINRSSWYFDNSLIAEKEKKVKKKNGAPFYSLRSPPTPSSSTSSNSRHRQNLHHSSVSLGSSNGSSSNLLNFLTPVTPTSAGSSSSPSTPRYYPIQASASASSVAPFRTNPPSPLFPNHQKSSAGNRGGGGGEHHPLKAYIQFGNTQQSLSSNQYHHLHPNHPKNQARLKRHYTAHYSAALARNHKSKQLQKQQQYPQHYYIHAGTMPGHKFVTFGPPADRHDRKGSFSSQHTVNGSSAGSNVGGGGSSSGGGGGPFSSSSSMSPSKNSTTNSATAPTTPTMIPLATAAKLVKDLNAYEDENFAIHIRTSTYEVLPFSPRQRPSTASTMTTTSTSTGRSKLGRKGSHGLMEEPSTTSGAINSTHTLTKSTSGFSLVSSSPTLCGSNDGSTSSPDSASAVTTTVLIPGITCFPSTMVPNGTIIGGPKQLAQNGVTPMMGGNTTATIMAGIGVAPGRPIVCEKSQALTLTGQALRLAPLHALKAAAFLYEHIHCARAQSIHFAIPWQSLESRYHTTITTLRDYQDMVMGDIGKALEMMAEIVEQEHRPLGHPDNRERDTKQMFGPRSFVAIYPPESRSDNRSRLSSKNSHLTTGYQEFCGSGLGSLLNSPSSPAAHHSGIGGGAGAGSPFNDSTSSNLDLHSNYQVSPAGSFANHFGGHDSASGGAGRRKSKSSGKFLSVPYATNTHSRLYQQQQQERDGAMSSNGSSLSKSNLKARRLSMGSFWKAGAGSTNTSSAGNHSSGIDNYADVEEKSTGGSSISVGGSFNGQRRRRSESESNLLNLQSNGGSNNRSKSSLGGVSTSSEVKDVFTHTHSLNPSQAKEHTPKAEMLVSLQKFLNVLIKPVKLGGSNENLSQGSAVGGMVGDGSSPTGTGGMFGRGGAKGRDLEAAWREDIQKRRRSLLAWCVRRFIALFRYSLTTENNSMAPDFGHIYNLFIAIPDLKNETGQPYPPVTETDGYFEQRLSLSKKKYSTPVPTIKGISKRFGLLNSEGEDPNAVAATQQHHHHNHSSAGAPATGPLSATGTKAYQFSSSSPDAALAGLGPGLRPRTRTRTSSTSKDDMGTGAAITLVSSPTDSSITSHTSSDSALSTTASVKSDSNGSATTAGSTFSSEGEQANGSSSSQPKKQKDSGSCKDDCSSVGSKKTHSTRPSLRIDTRTTRLLQQQHRQQQQQQQSQQTQSSQQQQQQEQQQQQQPGPMYNNKPLQNHFVQHQQLMQQQQYPYGLDQRATIHHQRQASSASKLDTLYMVHNYGATVHPHLAYHNSAGGHDNHGQNGFDNVEYFGLRELSIWEPFFDRVTRLESDLSNLLSERSLYQFLRRFHINKSGMARLSGSKKSEMLRVLDLIERCVLERADNDQCQTWFRMSSSATAVKQLADTGIHDFLTTYEGKNIIDEVNPVTLTGYFKRLLKEAGGLFCREVIELVIEVVSPTSLALDGETESWFCKSIDIVSKRIVQRLMLMDVDRAEVFYRLTTVLAKILSHSNRDLELESVALTKMIQVTELESISELATLGKWNGYWSCMISSESE